MYIRTLLTAAGLLAGSAAHAQSLDLGFACEFQGTPLTSADVTTFGDQTQGRYTCSIDYTNNALADLANVVLTLNVDEVVVNDLAPALPDGVPLLPSSASETWKMLIYAQSIAGSPSPSFSEANQTISFSLGTLPAQTSSEVFFTLGTQNAFPAGDVGATISATVDGAADASLAHTIRWDGTANDIRVFMIPGFQADRRLVGSATIDRFPSANTGSQWALSNAETDVSMTAYLPYWDPSSSSYKADGAFNGATHIPAMDPSDLAAHLALVDGAQQPVYRADLAAGTLTGPATGDNANLVITFDPTTNSLTANPGVWWSYESIEGQLGGHGKWRLRWEGALNPALPGAALDAGLSLPAEACVESAESGAITIGDPERCAADAGTIVADESLTANLHHIFCPGFNNFLADCHIEARPYTPGSEGTTLVRFQNDTSLSGLGTLYAQLPGEASTGQVATLTDLSIGPGIFSPSTSEFTGNVASAGVRLFVSDTPADYTGSGASTDISTRDLPSAGTVWEECTLVDLSSNGNKGCDLGSLAIAADSISQVRVDIENMQPRYLSLRDAYEGSNFEYQWHLRFDWVLADDAQGSIDSLNSATDTTNTSFGVKTDFTLEASTAVENTTDSQSAEVTRESIFVPCGVRAWDSTQWIQPNCTNGAFQSITTTVMDPFRFSYGFQNAGTIDNVRTPAEICVPIPVGMRLENSVTADRRFPRVAMGPEGSQNAPTLDPNSYTYTWTEEPGDPLIEATHCVQFSDTIIVPAGEALAVLQEARMIPGSSTQSTFVYSDNSRGPITANGEDASGASIVWNGAVRPAFVNLTGAGRIETTSTTSPGSPVGATTQLCYDFEHDSHAFDDSGTPTLDPGWATLPSQDGVSYAWVPSATQSDPASLTNANTGDTVFRSAQSPDDVTIWIHIDNAPVRGDSTTLGTNGWQVCAASPAACDATALSGLGLTTADVRWVAWEYGEMLITDAEPRGEAPFDGAPRVNNPYQASMCVDESGGTASTIRTVMETHTSNLLTVIAEPDEVIVNPDCPDGIVQQPTDNDCDGVDNDCDGSIDEETLAGTECTVGEGACQNTGVYECIAGRITTIECNVDPLPGSDELCNGIDDDCDGTVDNGFEGVGETCDNGGKGECFATGLTVCSTDGSGLDCDAPVISGTDELCDELDNDCDGFFDEAFPNLGDGCAGGEGECAYFGKVVCSADGLTAECSSQEGEPTSELCDNLDNDCDGSVDEEFPTVGEICTVGLGRCEASGLVVCLGDGSGVECDAEPGMPVGEKCDGIDNDCDGNIDEDYAGIGDACTEGEGECAVDGTLVCGTDGASVECDAIAGQPSEDLCDGLDNDCDGASDEDFPTVGDACADGEGECAVTGVVQCSTDGTAAECDAVAGDPVSELCDELDNDCDGSVDEEFPEAGTECSVGQGECLVTGFWYCLPDGSDAECDALEGTAALETCDGSDGDCDGVVDGTLLEDGVTVISACLDTDDDGIVDHTEYFGGGGTAYLNPDTDGDGIQDGTESGLTEPELDGATDLNVFIPDDDPTTTTDPLDDDTDDDCIIDGNEDLDGNGAVDSGEIDPNDPDTDGDGLQDGLESGVTEPQGLDTDEAVCTPDTDGDTTTDPLDDDTDNDCITDGNEDADGDGAVDSDETDGANADTDEDGIQDGTEIGLTGPQGNDTDTAECVPDEDPTTTTDPTNPDSDDDGLDDGEEDVDGDGLVDETETDPNDPDSDDGGVSDGEEVDRGTDPLAAEDDFPEELPEQWAQGGFSCQTGGGTPWMGGLLLLVLALRRREVA